MQRKTGLVPISDVLPDVLDELGMEHVARRLRLKVIPGGLAPQPKPADRQEPAA